MQVKRFALGIRFAVLLEQPENEFARKVFEEIFSVLTLSDLEGLSLYGGINDGGIKARPGDEEDIFLAVIMGGSIQQMRKVFEKIDADAAIGMYLAHSSPYIENNRLYKVEGLAYYGDIHKNGLVEGGNGLLSGLTVPKSRGRRKPVGKGIKVLLAPDSYGEGLMSEDAIKRLTVAARRHFQGVKLIPVPMTGCGDGLVRSLVTATDGVYRRSNVTVPGMKDKQHATYGVLRGRTAIISTAPPEGIKRLTSAAAGELICRALDEGLTSFLVGVHENCLGDFGFGCARALGMKFFDADGAEVTDGDLSRIASADAEYLHPRLRGARFTVACASLDAPCGGEDFYSAVASACGREAAHYSGFPSVLAALTGARVETGFEPLLAAMDFERLLKGVALAVTGGADPSSDAARSILEHCGRRGVPVSMIIPAGAAAPETAAPLGLMPFGPSPADPGGQLAAFDAAADRMFRLIRIGRDVEKIGAPKKVRQKTFVELQIEMEREQRKKAEAAVDESGDAAGAQP